MPLSQEAKKLFQSKSLAIRASSHWRDIVIGTAMRIVERNGDDIHPAAAILMAIELVDRIRDLSPGEQGLAQRIFERQAAKVTPDKAVELAKETLAIAHQAFSEPLDLDLEPALEKPPEPEPSL